MTDKPWSCEVRVLSGGTEHSIGGRVADRDAALSVAAMAIDALGELLTILSDADAETEPKPLEPNVWRELWHWRVSWTELGDGWSVEHVCRSWTPTAADTWRELADAAENLTDLAEIVRQTRGPRPPRMLGEDAPTWDDQLAAYDTKAAESAARDAARSEHLAREHNLGIDARVIPTDRRD